MPKKPNVATARSKKAKRKAQPLQRPVAPAPTYTAPVRPVVTRPAPTARPKSQVTLNYSYVIPELRRIATFGGAIFVILGILAVLLLR